MNSADQILKECSGLFKQRHKLYGDNYKRHGEVMKALFPNGIALKTIEDHNRFGILTQMVAKMTRYGEQFSKGGHLDSIIDLCTYSAILAELERKPKIEVNNDEE